MALSDRFVFLSASYPSREYKANSHEVARAVKMLLGAVFRADGRIVFGGHPSISPLVLMMAREHGAKHRVAIYQSKLYADLISEATRQLEAEGYGKIRFTEAEPGEKPEPGKNIKSLWKMRVTMIEECDPIAAIFVGGDTGLRDELELFQKLRPGRPTIPLGRPGGAARDLLTKVSLDARYDPIRKDLDGSPNYLTLMRKIVTLLSPEQDRPSALTP